MKNILFIPLVLCSTILAQVQVEFQADSLHGTLGDIIEFQWHIQHAVGAEFQLQDVEMGGTGIEILDQSLVQEENSSTLNFQTAIYDSVGLYQFPSVKLLMRSEGGEDTLNLPGPPLQIISILTASDTTFRDIKGLHHIRLPLNWVLVILVLLAMALVYAAITLYRRYKRAQTAGSGPTIVPPEEAHILAFRELAALENTTYLQNQKYKNYYSELTHILKEYFENRFLLDALECTSSELLEKMDALTEFDGKIRSKTANLLHTADLIKFAKATSTTKEASKSFDVVYGIVKSTRIIQEDQSDGQST